jgi:chromosome segregation ATPase
MSRVEQDLMRRDHEAELERVRFSMMAQQRDADETLSRKTAECDGLSLGLGDVLARELTLRNQMEALRHRLAISDENLMLARSSLNGFADLGAKMKSIEVELEGARGRAYKLQVQNTQLEQKMNSDTREFDKANSNAKILESKINQLEADLASSREQLHSTEQLLVSAQRSLELTEGRCSSTHQQYESTKEKLDVCNKTLENERAIMQNLKDTLTLDVYRSLGATYQSMGAFLSAVGQPQISDNDGGTALKRESD